MRSPVVGTLFFFLVACGSSPSSPNGNPPGNNPPGNNPPAGNTVTLNAVSFSPSSLTVNAGSQVTWTNASGIPHTITPVGHTQWTGVNVSATGTVLTVTFPTAGSFPYECQLHAGMDGTIVVQ